MVDDPADAAGAADALLDADPTWVDLLDVTAEHRVLLLDAADSGAAAALRRLTPHVTVVGCSPDATPSSPATRPVSPGTCDLLAFDGVRVTDASLRRWRPALAPGARLVVVGDNRASPLRALDRMTRGSGGPGARWSHVPSVRCLVEHDLDVHQLFGLLRSSAAPAVAFDALAGSSLHAVVGATLAHVHGWRAGVLGVAARARAERVLRLCPGWLVVASAPGAELDPERVVGKVSNRDSEEVKLLRGDPVASIERSYRSSHPAGTATEVAALLELERVGFALAPRVLADPSAFSSRCSWLRGDPLAVDRLRPDDLVDWVGRAAEVLRDLQDRTRRPDGTVLVHGDFWLGNLMTEGGRVTGVVDWTEAHRGSPVTDREFLVSSLERWISSERLRRRLVEAAGRAAGNEAG